MSDFAKILLDANALINAAFLPQSFAARAVVLARQHRHSQFFVGEGVMREVNEIVVKHAPDESHRLRAENQVSAFLQGAAAKFIVDDDSSPAPNFIPKNDRHVYHAARQTGAAVLTADAGLWLGCRKCNVPAFLPLELIRQLDGIALQTTIFGVTPTPAAGSLFARVYPGVWAGRVSGGKFTVAHFPGGFWLYYDAAKSAWLAEVEELAKSLVVKAPVLTSGLQTVCLSWACDGDKSQIQMRVVGIMHPATLDLIGPLDFRPSGVPTIGCSSNVQHHWNGHIYYCITNDKPVGNTPWKKYQQHRDLAPNPYDADRVTAAIRSLCPSAVPPAPTFS